jgi:hypothetical protein
MFFNKPRVGPRDFQSLSAEILSTIQQLAGYNAIHTVAGYHSQCREINNEAMIQEAMRKSLELTLISEAYKKLRKESKAEVVTLISLTFFRCVKTIDNHLLCQKRDYRL